jgi:hypothetical protein
MKRDYRLFIKDIIAAMESTEGFVEGMSFEELMQDTIIKQRVIKLGSNVEPSVFQSSPLGRSIHAQSEVNSCFDLLHFLGAQGGKLIAKTVFGYGGNSIQVSNAVSGHAIIGSQGHLGGDVTDTRARDEMDRLLGLMS